ncbi:hypothetical protein B7486_54840 [cyanobacterium TDX16]|nr:hypothetical protein B7486_54840 [cyanobacterium TDX16]
MAVTGGGAVAGEVLEHREDAGRQVRVDVRLAEGGHLGGVLREAAFGHRPGAAGRGHVDHRPHHHVDSDGSDGVGVVHQLLLHRGRVAARRHLGLAGERADDVAQHLAGAALLVHHHQRWDRAGGLHLGDALDQAGGVRALQDHRAGAQLGDPQGFAAEGAAVDGDGERLGGPLAQGHLPDAGEGRVHGGAGGGAGLLVGHAGVRRGVVDGGELRVVSTAARGGEQGQGAEQHGDEGAPARCRGAHPTTLARRTRLGACSPPVAGRTRRGPHGSSRGSTTRERGSWARRCRCP